MIIPRSKKRYKVKTPGGKNVMHFKKKRPSYARCKKCGAKLNRPKLAIDYISERPGQVKRHNASTKKALEILGWKAKTDFEDGIDKTIKWYKKNVDWWKKLLWMRRVPIRTKNGLIEYH